jgi:hypothetical protein
MPLVQTEVRALNAGALQPLDTLLRELKLREEFSGDLTIVGRDPLLRSPHHLSEATAYALLLEAAAAANIWKQKTGQTASSKIELADAIHSLHSTHFLWHSGYSLSVGAEYVPTNGIFKCKDGNYIMIEAGPPYAKLERGYLNFFDCGNNRESIAREIAKYDSIDLQERLSELGLPACRVFSREEWWDHPQGKRLANTPLIEIDKIGEGKPKAWSTANKFPLEGIRVVDFTHVLAGPRSMRGLAQYGAEVLHISSPYHRDTVSQNLLVNIGKKSAYLDLRQQADQSTMRKLLKESDVFACSYRTSVAERFALLPQDIVKDHDGIICLSVNAYGHEGSWKNRPGFDQNAQCATGFAMTEGRGGTPRFSPVFYLNDLLTAYLASAGVMAALSRRAKEGGSYHVKLSLARTAMWVQDLGLIPESEYEVAPVTDDYPVKTHDLSTTCGAVRELVPAVEVTGMPRCHLELLRPFGADPPRFD